MGAHLCRQCRLPRNGEGLGTEQRKGGIIQGGAMKQKKGYRNNHTHLLCDICPRVCEVVPACAVARARSGTSSRQGRTTCRTEGTEDGSAVDWRAHMDNKQELTFVTIQCGTAPVWKEPVKVESSYACMTQLRRRQDIVYTLSGRAGHTTHLMTL